MAESAEDSQVDGRERRANNCHRIIARTRLERPTRRQAGGEGVGVSRVESVALQQASTAVTTVDHPWPPGTRPAAGINDRPTRDRSPPRPSSKSVPRPLIRQF